MRWGRRGYREASPAKSKEDVSETNASEANATQAGEIQKEAKQKRRRNGPNKRDTSEITCYNCNKKSHYAKYYTEPKD